jgi:hypothetical protein
MALLNSATWTYVPFSSARPCNVVGMAWRRGKLLPWRRRTDGRDSKTTDGDGEMMVHHFSAGTATDCGVYMYNELQLRTVKTNWTVTDHAVTCRKC